MTAEDWGWGRGVEGEEEAAHSQCGQQSQKPVDVGSAMQKNGKPSQHLLSASPNRHSAISIS